MVVTRILDLALGLFNKRKPDVDEYGYGSASLLEGEVYTLVCFVSEIKKEGWSSDGKERMLALLEESQEWIRKQAREYPEVTVDFIKLDRTKDIIDIEFEKDDIPEGTGSEEEPVNLVSKILYAAGHKSTLEWEEEVKKKTGATNVQVLIFIKDRAGRSYAMASSDKMDKEEYFVEGAVLFEKQNDDTDLYSSVIAHEILHIYGAWDLYGTFQTEGDEEKLKKHNEYLGKSIMLKTPENIDHSKVDILTAWLVGWNKDPEPWFESFEPKPKSQT